MDSIDIQMVRKAFKLLAVHLAFIPADCAQEKTMNEISEINENNDELIDQINYRGFSFSVWQNSVQYYTVVAGKIITICDRNRNYRDYIYKMIDDQLDRIYA